LPGDPDDTHSRYIEAEIDSLIIGCLYVPNGNPAPGPKFDYKLHWFERLNNHAELLLKKHAPTVLCGDYNVVPTPIDAVVPQRWIGDAVYFPESRRAYAQLLEDGWIDAVRRVHPQRGVYTYWNFSFSGRLRSKLWSSNGPSACEPVANGQDSRRRRRRRAPQLGKAKRPCASLDRARLTRWGSGPLADPSKVSADG
jgi:exodeoxyribonuclease III